MATEAAAAAGTSLTGSFEKLLLSSARFSGAATLYGVQQLEATVNVFQEGEGFTKQVDKFGTTVETLTRCIADEISPGKKDALDSISSVTGRLVRQSLQGMSFLDPRLFLRLSNTLVQKTSKTVSGWVRKQEPSPEEEPKLAADVLH